MVCAKGNTEKWKNKEAAKSCTLLQTAQHTQTHLTVDVLVSLHNSLFLPQWPVHFATQKVDVSNITKIQKSPLKIHCEHFSFLHFDKPASPGPTDITSGCVWYVAISVITDCPPPPHAQLKNNNANLQYDLCDISLGFKLECWLIFVVIRTIIDFTENYVHKK